MDLFCPYCGEAVDLDIDESGGSRQTFLQDCPVCCQPWHVEVWLDPEIGWTATLKKADE
ncbi:MAG: CPXCG motif-containing cysteine-rich protein [Chitinivibrionales bacterium]